MNRSSTPPLGLLVLAVPLELKKNGNRASRVGPVAVMKYGVASLGATDCRQTRIGDSWQHRSRQPQVARDMNCTIRVKPRSQTVVAGRAVGNGLHVLETLLTVIEKGEDPGIVVLQHRRECRACAAVATLNSRVGRWICTGSLVVGMTAVGLSKCHSGEEQHRHGYD